MIRLCAASIATAICDEVTTYPGHGRTRTNCTCSFSVLQRSQVFLSREVNDREGHEHSRL